MAILSEIMSRDVFEVAADASVSEAAAGMVNGRFGSAIVKESGWLAGIFTERDVLRAAASGQNLAETPVSEWMTRDPMTAEPTMESEQALEIMAANGFRHLPVCEGKDVIGIVSLRDLLATRIRAR